MLAAGRKFADRVWAVEGCNGIGRHIAHRLVADGEPVVDVPAKLSAQGPGVRHRQRPQDRPGRCALGRAGRAARSRPASHRRRRRDLVVLGLLADRRDELGGPGPRRSTGCTGCCWSCSPAGRRSSCPPPRPRTLLAAVRPRDIAGKTRRRLAAELITELDAIDRQAHQVRRRRHQGTGHRDRQHAAAAARHRPLRRGAAARRRRRHPRGSPTGTASRPGTAPHRWMPPPATRTGTGSPAPATGGSTGSCTSWPSSRCATTPKAAPTTGASSLPAKPPWKRLRCLKRRLSDVVYRQMCTDAKRAQTGPGGHAGATLQSSAADPIPTVSTSEQSLPGPATHEPRTLFLSAS